MNSKKLVSAQHDLKQINQSIESSLENKASLIDIDLSLDKIRSLYELMTEVKLEILSKSNTVTEENKSQVKSEVKEPEQVSEPKFTPTPKAETKIVEKEVSATPTPEIKIDFIDETPVVEKEKAAKKDTLKTEAKKTTPPVNEIKKEEPLVIDTNETVADQFENKKSLNDILSDIKENDDLATQLKNSPIRDLKSAISLNDKIWFTRELFNGDNKKYIETIDTFNTMNNMDEALHLANTFSWNKDEASTKHFLELIYRRFV